MRKKWTENSTTIELSVAYIRSQSYLWIAATIRPSWTINIRPEDMALRSVTCIIKSTETDSNNKGLNCT